jgi:16S rRNA (uracil1498-N3)-methyltransferase
MNHFFCGEIKEGIGFLSEQDSHHAVRVLRLTEGSIISVSPNNGKVYAAQILNAKKNELRFKCSEILREEKRPLLSIAIAPTKSNDRFEWFLEKATEIGVADIYPILCANSERKVYKTNRGEKVIMAAAKQSKKGFLPRLHKLQKLKSFVQKYPGSNRFIAHLVEGPKLPISDLNFKDECTFLIGPEGDFIEDEVQLALKESFKSISLGDEILRTETAGLKIAAAAALLG